MCPSIIFYPLRVVGVTAGYVLDKSITEPHQREKQLFRLSPTPRNMLELPISLTCLVLVVGGETSESPKTRRFCFTVILVLCTFNKNRYVVKLFCDGSSSLDKLMSSSLRVTPAENRLISRGHSLNIYGRTSCIR